MDWDILQQLEYCLKTTPLKLFKIGQLLIMEDLKLYIFNLIYYPNDFVQSHSFKASNKPYNQWLPNLYFQLWPLPWVLNLYIQLPIPYVLKYLLGISNVPCQKLRLWFFSQSCSSNISHLSKWCNLF